jgi:hypothetical protein
MACINILLDVGFMLYAFENFRSPTSFISLDPNSCLLIDYIIRSTEYKNLIQIDWQIVEYSPPSKYPPRIPA